MLIVFYKFLSGSLPQQRANLAASIIRQRSYRFIGHPRDQQADAHINDKIDRNIYRLAHASAIKAVVKEYIKGLQDQKVPYDKCKALLSQKLRKFIAKQTIFTEAEMYADDHKACTKCIERDHVYIAW